MAILGSATCRHCGAAFAIGSAKCPFCGAATSSDPGQLQLAVAPSVRGSRPLPADTPKRQPSVLVPAAAVGIVVLGGLSIFALAQRAPSQAAPVPAVSAPAEALRSAPKARPAISPLADLSHVDASDLYPRLKEQALAWNNDAQLVSITASPVVGDKVDLTRPGAEIVYAFTSARDLASPGKQGGRIAFTVSSQGTTQSVPSEAPRTAATPHAPGSPAPLPQPLDIGEPNCVFDAAVKAVRASGIVRSEDMKLRYEADRALGRATWSARSVAHPEMQRTLDANTCAVLVKH